MTREKILEGNKLICKFACIKDGNGSIYSNTMGGYPVGTMHFNLSNCPINTIYPFDHINHYRNSGEWHYNWSWLMPVVEKIAELDNVYKIEIYPTIVTTIYSDETFEYFGGIEAIYKSVVDFLKWYNNEINE